MTFLDAGNLTRDTMRPLANIGVRKGSQCLISGRFSTPSTIDEITAIDLIATYMKTFGFGQRNLHGDGPHALAEYDARRKRIQAGLAQLVIVGAATVDSTCLLYRATPECFQYSEALHGDYAASYRQAVQLLIKNDYETIMNRITKENNQL